MLRRASFLLVCAAAACGGGSGSDTTPHDGGKGGGGAAGSGGGGHPDASAPKGTSTDFDLSGDVSKDFYALPWPSDLRLTKEGTPDVTGFPNPKKVLAITQVLSIIPDRKGFPVIPVAYFHFDGALKKLDSTTVIAADASSPILLIDVDPASPELGRLIPTVATTPPSDDYVPEHLLAMAARPGFVLAPHRQYAFVVRRELKDKKGDLLDVPDAMQELAAGKDPAGALGKQANALYAPLFSVLKKVGVAANDVAAATVFTTGDVVEDLAATSDLVLAAHSITIKDLHVDPVGGDHSRFCELLGTVTYPQFQTGKPPFDTEGVFVIGKDGAPEVQREEDAPICIALPKGTMPKGGYPLDVYFHGSGGLSTEVVDRGAVTVVGGMETPGEGPSYVLAPFGIATAGSAMPLNPERFPGATETEYLNISNLAAFRFTFQQGALEARMFRAALEELTIPPEVVASCTGLSMASGEQSYHFNGDELLAQGQSMGAMYANLTSAIEPKYKIVLPTGAGGFWTYFILTTQLIPNAGALIGPFLIGTNQPLTFMHPGLAMTETAWEPIDPIVFMPRLAQRPLKGHPTRPVYDPVGKGDSYFPTELYDAIALAYGHREAGTEVWSTMQKALALNHLDGIVPYPVYGDAQGVDGGPKYTGVIIQYEGDGIYDPHSIFSQLDSVKYQYGCFFDSFLRTGNAVVPAPAAFGTPCPTK